MFQNYRIDEHGPYKIGGGHATLPLAVEHAISMSQISPEDVLLVAEGKPYRIEAVYRDGARVSFSASVPT